MRLITMRGWQCWPFQQLLLQFRGEVFNPGQIDHLGSIWELQDPWGSGSVGGAPALSIPGVIWPWKAESPYEKALLYFRQGLNRPESELRQQSPRSWKPFWPHVLLCLAVAVARCLDVEIAGHAVLRET
jgi:hypothetical protein